MGTDLTNERDEKKYFDSVNLPLVSEDQKHSDDMKI